MDRRAFVETGLVGVISLSSSGCLGLFEIGELHIDSSGVTNVVSGEFIIVAIVRNAGDIGRDVHAAVEVDGEVVGEKEFHLEPQDWKGVEFLQQAADYSVGNHTACIYAYDLTIQSSNDLSVQEDFEIRESDIIG